MYSIVLAAAIITGTQVVDLEMKPSRAPGPVSPLLGAAPAPEYIYALPVTPRLYASDAHPVECPPPGWRGVCVNRQTAYPGRALLIVQLPFDADLYFNWYYVKSASNRRVFLTRVLLPGHSYFYELKAQVYRSGRLYTTYRRVVFRPGEVVVISFGEVCPFADQLVPAGTTLQATPATQPFGAEK
jgi:uncharacterized protein (TIGR03000 family)